MRALGRLSRQAAPPGSRRRRWVFGATVLAVAGSMALFVANAFAVHELVFQLDGNAISSECGTTPDGNCSKQIYDWGGTSNNIFNVTTGTSTQTVSNNDSVVGASKTFEAANFVRDFESGSPCALNSTSTIFCTADDTTYATGSKDTLGIGNGGWQCNHDNNVNSKIDIMNAYAASYIDPTTKDHIIYFAMEKNKNNGTNDVGFWFLQNQAGCSAPSGHLNFTGSHRDGDVLVVSEFTAGGGVSTIKAFRWAANSQFPGDGGCIDSNDNPNPRTGGCNGLPIGSGGDCKNANGGDFICATTNSGSLATNTNIDVPWLTSDATLHVGNTVVPPDFFEGGIDITKEFGSAGGTTPSCFSTVVPDTRSSATITATLFDFALNQLGECQTNLTTQQNAVVSPATSISIGGGSVSSGTDSATLTITGTPAWAGTLKWYLCGPVSTDTCDNTGVLVTTKNVSSTDASNTYTSDAATLTSAGRYCWHAHFEPDSASSAAGVKAADEQTESTECFTVSPVTPQLSTTAVLNANGDPIPANYKFAFGSSVFDTATLSGAATEPGTNGAQHGGNATYPSIDATDLSYAGTIAFDLRGPDGGTPPCSTTDATGTGTNPQTVNVDSTTGNKTYGPVGFQPGTPGTYHWVSTYTNANSVNNTSPVTHNADCSDGTEAVTVQQIPTDIQSKQSWYPNDTATVCSGTCSSTNSTLSTGGTLDFYLYNDATCTAGTNNVNLVYSERIAITGGGAKEEKSTHNYAGGGGTAVPAGATPAGTGSWSPFAITTSYGDVAGSGPGGANPTTGGYSWLVKYIPPDTTHTGSSSSCTSAAHTEMFSTTYTNDNGN